MVSCDFYSTLLGALSWKSGRQRPLEDGSRCRKGPRAARWMKWSHMAQGCASEAEYPVFTGFHRDDAAAQARCVLSHSHDSPGIAGISEEIDEPMRAGTTWQDPSGMGPAWEGRQLG